MADLKISQLNAITTLTPATDVLPVVDVTGTTKKITTNQILGSGGTATLASATISGDLTVATSVLKVDTINDRVGIGTASPTAKMQLAITGSASAITRVNSFGNDGSFGFPSLASNSTGAFFGMGVDQNSPSAGFGFFRESTGWNTALVFYTNNQTGGANVDTIYERYRIDSSGVSTWSVGGSTAMTLNSTGLLIGTTNNFASSRLCVQGTAGTATPDVTIGIPVNASSNTNLAIGRSASTGGYIYLDAYKAGVGGTELVLNSINGGSVLVGLSTVVAAGGCLQLKSGITFPATQVASSDVNTLDDYEEGNWTPTITAGSGTPTTTSINTAKYTKIGRLVTLEVDISITAIGTASGVLNFTVPTGFNQSTDGNVGALREVGATASMGQIFYTAPTTVGMAIYNNATVWVNGYRVRGTYTYTV